MSSQVYSLQLQYYYTRPSDQIRYICFSCVFHRRYRIDRPSSAPYSVPGPPALRAAATSRKVKSRARDSISRFEKS